MILPLSVRRWCGLPAASLGQGTAKRQNDAQNLLNEPLPSHDFLKDEVVRNGQVFPDLVDFAPRHFLHGRHSFLARLYAEGNDAGKKIHCAARFHWDL